MIVCHFIVIIVHFNLFNLILKRWNLILIFDNILKSMKKLSFIFVITLAIQFFAPSFLQAQVKSSLSENEKQLIIRTMDARLSTRLCSTPDEAIKKMEEYKNSLNLDKVSLSEEAYLIIENMIILEEYNYMYAKNMKSPELKPFILAQYQKIADFKSAHEGQTFTPWFCLSAGDVINSSMQFIPQGTAISLGLKEKEEYDSIVKSSSDLSFGYINAGLWYYFAPAIGGGSRKIADQYFKNAVKIASNNYEKFYSRIYLSQLYFEDGNFVTCQALLSECDEILPGNLYTPFIRFLNDSKYSLLYYTNNREKVERKIGIYIE